MEVISFIVLLVRSRIIRATLDDIWDCLKTESLKVEPSKEDSGGKEKSELFFVLGPTFTCNYERCRADSSREKIHISRLVTRGGFTVHFRNGKFTEWSNGIWSSKDAESYQKFLMENILARVQHAIMLHDSALARGISPGAA